jgi:hypothetical protein
MSRRRHLLSAGALLIAVFGLAACNRHPMMVRSGPGQDSRPLSASDKRGALPGVCRLTIDPLVDSRMDPTTLGQVGKRVVRAPTHDMAGWLRGMLGGLGQRNVDLHFEPAAQAPATHGLVARAELMTVWLNSLSTTLVANVVMRFDYRRKGVSVGSGTYRGNETVVNWNSTDSEIQGALDQAFNEVLDQVRIDLDRLCFSGKP